MLRRRKAPSNQATTYASLLDELTITEADLQNEDVSRVEQWIRAHASPDDLRASRFWTVRLRFEGRPDDPEVLLADRHVVGWLNVLVGALPSAPLILSDRCTQLAIRASYVDYVGQPDDGRLGLALAMRVAEISAGGWDYVEIERSDPMGPPSRVPAFYAPFEARLQRALEGLTARQWLPD